MRTPKAAYWILLAGLLSFAIAGGVYSHIFGHALSTDQSAWSEFGSFFGGVLGPVMAFLAIVMLFITLASQIGEFRKSVEHLDASARTANDELELLKTQNTDNETLAVLAGADRQLTLLLQTDISDIGATQRTTIFHMCLESRRFSGGEEPTGAYAQFVKFAQTRGSVIWSYVEAIRELVGQVSAILDAHSNSHRGRYSPTVMYYHHRVVGLTGMLVDTGYMTEKERIHIVTMADQHG